MKLTTLSVLGLLFAIARSECPDLKSMKFKGDLDMSKSAGHWFEVAYRDIAQIGASCQQNNNTFEDETGSVKQSFSTKYGPIPFHQTYVYEPIDGERGLYVNIGSRARTHTHTHIKSYYRYTKYLQGARALLTLPTVILDVVEDYETGEYSVLTEYTCKSVAGVVKATEFRISARSKTISNETMTLIKQVAADKGVPEDDIQGLHIVDRTKC